MGRTTWWSHAVAIALIATLAVVAATACGRSSTESGARGGSPSGTSQAAPASTTTPPSPGPLQAAATAAQAQLSGLAESTCGHYYGASSGEALARAVLLAAVDKLPYRILDAAGKEVAKGEAGVDRAHELPAGNYTVVITAADQELRTPVTVAAAKDVVLKALIKGDTLVVDK